MPSCRTNLVGIQLYYCVDGVLQDPVWLDLKSVQALSWCDGKIKEKNGGGGSNKLPTTSTGPRSCPGTDEMTAAAAEVPICWWNGTEWVCGNEL